MYLCGYSLDNLSLMALTIATGFVVDDAIVVIENITRYIERGMPPREAALRGAREIGFTVLSMSVSLVAVFIPILLMGGMVGRLFREFAVTLSVAIVHLAGRVADHDADDVRRAAAPHEPGRAHGRPLSGRSERGLDWHAARATTRSLGWALRHRAHDAGADAADGRASTSTSTSIVPKGFFPQQDTGRLDRRDPGGAGHLVPGDAGEARRRSPA